MRPGLRRPKGVSEKRRGPRDGREDVVVLPEVGTWDGLELVVRAERGDRTAFAELFRRHEETVWSVARAISGTDEEALTPVVDAFVGLQASAIPPGVSVRAHLAARARDASIERSRSRRTVPVSLVERSDGDGLEEPDRHPHDPLDLTAPREDPLSRLPWALPPPPPELWALVQVAWNDQLTHDPVESSP